MAPPQRIAVVVASSRVGKATIDALVHATSSDPLHKGTAIRAVLRDPSKADPQWALQGVEVVSGLNTEDTASLAAAFDGVDKAFIVAPQVENRADVVNALLTAAKAHGVRHVALIGGVFQEEERFLFHQQWMSSRRKAEELELIWTQLECSDFMENLLGSCGSIQQERRIYGVFPDGISSPVALNDIGRAAAAVLLGDSSQHSNKAYRIVGLQALSPREVASVIGDVTGTTVEFEDVGLEASKQVHNSTAHPDSPSAVQGSEKLCLLLCK